MTQIQNILCWLYWGEPLEFFVRQEFRPKDCGDKLALSKAVQRRMECNKGIMAAAIKRLTIIYTPTNINGVLDDFADLIIEQIRYIINQAT